MEWVVWWGLPPVKKTVAKDGKSKLDTESPAATIFTPFDAAK